MEQLNITTAKDSEKVYKILGDLLSANKEFQIMIDVNKAINLFFLMDFSPYPIFIIPIHISKEQGNPN